MRPQTRSSVKRDIEQMEVIEVHGSDSEEEILNPKRQKLSAGTFNSSLMQSCSKMQ